MKRCLLLPLAAIVLLIPSCEPPAVEGKKVGNLSPDIAGTDVDNKPIRLSDYKGKVVLVNFWGTWCPPCRRQIPHEIDMVTNRYRSRPFALLGIANDPPEVLQSFLKQTPLPWANIVDGRSPGFITQQWDVSAFPSAVLIDHKGIILASWLNGMNPDVVWGEVEKAVKAAEKK